MIVWVQQSGPIVSVIDAEKHFNVSVSITAAIGPDCLIHNILSVLNDGGNQNDINAKLYTYTY